MPETPNRPPPTLALSPELSEELRFALAEHGSSSIALRDAACTFLNALRLQGRSHGEARAELKAFVETTRMQPALSSPDVGDEPLLDHIVAWCQERSPSLS